MPRAGSSIQAHRDGGFTIAGVRHEGSVLVLPERTLPWPVRALDAVTLESLARSSRPRPALDLLVLGCGAAFGQPAADLRAALRARGIVIEAMDTRAACRTFNVLLAEDRRVAAALIALSERSGASEDPGDRLGQAGDQVRRRVLEVEVDLVRAAQHAGLVALPVVHLGRSTARARRGCPALRS